MMSVASFPQIAQGLIEAGMESDMDAAVIENGTMPNQRKFVSKLCDIPKVIAENQVKSPAIIIVGKVCSLSEKLDWFFKIASLRMQCIGNRPKENIGEIGRQTRGLGAHVVEYPCIEQNHSTLTLIYESIAG